MEVRYSFSLRFLLRFWKLHLLFYSSQASIAVFFLLITVSALYQFVGYRVGLISGNFFEVLVNKDQDEFGWVCLKSTGLILAATVTKAGKDFLSRRLMVLWRRSLTSHLQELYIRGNNFYHIQGGRQEVDNPDQRLTADVSSMLTSYQLLIQNDLFILPAATGYYAYKAYCASTWVGPTAMFGLFLLSFLNKFLMSPVAKRTARLEKREGDFRYLHTNLREHAEALALQGGGEEELARSQSSLGLLCTAQEHLYDWTLALDLSTNLFSYLGSILSYLVISIPIFSGYYDNLNNGELTKAISNNSFVCMQLVWQMTQLVNMADTAASMAGSTHRVAEMLEVLEWGPREQHHHPEPPQEVVMVSLQNTDIVVPSSGKVLVNALSLELVRGKDILVMGPSGAGKTSILRVLRGLWPTGGCVAMLGHHQTACLPQREFLGDGSLRSQLEGGGSEMGGYEEDASLLDLLNLVGLAGLVVRCGGLDGGPGQAWSQALSPGERQRLLWARLLHQRPALALLDEATSAVSEEVQEVLYREARARDITMLSVGHRNSLRSLHSQLLLLDGHGGWRVEDLAPLL